MTDFKLKLAGFPLEVHALFAETKQFCRDYLTEEAPLLEITMERGDLERIRKVSEETDRKENRGQSSYSASYLETLALYEKITEALLPYGVLLFHGSVVAVDGNAYMFTARSGVGKTTHTRLWLKNIPGCHVLNGDKPLIRFSEDGIFACGTPWQGKENLGVNEILPLKAICLLERGDENVIAPVDFHDAFNMLLTQSHHPGGGAGMVASVKLLENLRSVSLYRLRCRMDDEAARVSYRGMKDLSFEEILARDGVFCWKNVGCSMLPLIREGRDIIVIRKRPEGRLKKFDAVLFRRPGVTGRGAYVLHRIYRVNPDGTYYIVGDNCGGGETVKEENVIGILSAVRRQNGRTVQADSLSCRVYSRLAYLTLPLRFLYSRCMDLARLVWHRIRKK